MPSLWKVIEEGGILLILGEHFAKNTPSRYRCVPLRYSDSWGYFANSKGGILPKLSHLENYDSCGRGDISPNSI